jgi:hypothetical protein
MFFSFLLSFTNLEGDEQSLENIVNAAVKINILPDNGAELSFGFSIFIIHKINAIW